MTSPNSRGSGIHCPIDPGNVGSKAYLMIRTTCLQPPSLFHYQSESFFGGAHGFHWDGSRLWAARRNSLAIEPSDLIWEELSPPKESMWKRLKVILDAIESWEISADDIGRLITDGTHWELKIKWGKRRWSAKDYSVWPTGFQRLDRWMEAHSKAPSLTGIPGPFCIHDERGGEGWSYFWDGRTLSWIDHSAVGAPPRRGCLHAPPPEQWSPFMAACQLVRPSDLEFREGKWAGVSMKCRPSSTFEPGTQISDQGGGWLDPGQVLVALKQMVPSAGCNY